MDSYCRGGGGWISRQSPLFMGGLDYVEINCDGNSLSLFCYFFKCLNEKYFLCAKPSVAISISLSLFCLCPGLYLPHPIYIYELKMNKKNT